MDWGLTIGGNYFNSIDVIMFIIMIIGGIGGAFVGFISSFSKTAGYVVGFFAGLMFTVKLSMTFGDTFGMSQFPSSLIAFLVLFLVGYLLVVLLGSVLSKVVNINEGLSAIDKLLGFFWCMLYTLVLLGVICYFLRMQTLFNVSPLFGQSQFISRIIDPLTPKAVDFVTGQIH